MSMGGNGKGKEIEIPADLKDRAQEAHEKLVEQVAEGNDALDGEIFRSGTSGKKTWFRHCIMPSAKTKFSRSSSALAWAISAQTRAGLHCGLHARTFRT